MKPSEEDLTQALKAAEQLREHEDLQHLGHALLYLQRRNRLLEEVFEHAMLFVQFGLDEFEHKKLVKAIEAAREQEAKEIDEEYEELGLG